MHKLQSELDKVQHRLGEQEVETSVGKAAGEAAMRDISALKGELKAHAEAAAKVPTITCIELFTTECMQHSMSKLPISSGRYSQGLQCVRIIVTRLMTTLQEVFVADCLLSRF